MHEIKHHQREEKPTTMTIMDQREQFIFHRKWGKIEGKTEIKSLKNNKKKRLLILLFSNLQNLIMVIYLTLSSIKANQEMKWNKRRANNQVKSNLFEESQIMQN